MIIGDTDDCQGSTSVRVNTGQATMIIGDTDDCQGSTSVGVNTGQATMIIGDTDDCQSWTSVRWISPVTRPATHPTAVTPPPELVPLVWRAPKR